LKKAPDNRETERMSRAVTNLQIDSARLWGSIHETAQFGATAKGGVRRLTLSAEDKQVRDWFRKACEEAGLEVHTDALGSQFGLRKGRDMSKPPVGIGSHLDTQPTGGKFDGILGTLAALEVVRTLNAAGIETETPLCVINWTNEEGSRFAPAMMASGAYAGDFAAEDILARKDAEGITVAQALAEISYSGDEPVGARRLGSFVELHIEQGPILEDEGIDIGVVTHGQGLKWLQVTLTGKEAHTGSTPMPKRRNASLGMARVIELVHHTAMSHQPDAVGAVGHIEVYPNSRNIIAGKAVFTIDIRSPSKATLDEMDLTIRTGIEAIISDMDIGAEIEQVGHFDPVTFDETCVSAIRDAAERLGYSHRNIISGAGHDACWINRVAPTAMVMCPCVDGLSHNEAEDISKEWASAGADVLFHAVVETAGIVE
jgi:N-carbamoyl-L-amino-acid hydrolase